jgi:transcription antitermination factor NusA-like protein
MSLEEDYSSLQRVSLHDAVEAEGILGVIVERGDVATLLSYGGKIIRELGKKLGKKIRVLERGSDDRKFLEDLFSPFSIVTINTIWLPDGTIDTRVILRRGRRKPPSRTLDALMKIAQEVRGMTIRVEFAR